MKWVLFFLLMGTQLCYSKDPLAGHHQLLVVTTRDWEEKRGDLQRYERDDLSWIPVGGSIPVVLGESGLGWGIGLHPTPSERLAHKKEGDGKSPAGIFSLGTAFGFAPSCPLKIEYLPLDEHIEAVDDPLSRYYNSVVSNIGVVPDWQSSEKMRSEPLYQWGLVINHNFPHPQIGAGSAIFFHIWHHEHSGTAGCTAMSEENLMKLLSWLERDKNPALVQLPIFTYHEFQEDWNLPMNANTYHFVDLSQICPDILLDIRYATSNNFLGFPVYSSSTCYLHKDVAEALVKVQKELSKIHLRLKVFDGYRPLSAQQIMWDAVQDERYVANPAKYKGRHTRGTAVDLTLVDRHGDELEMPTEFDDFSEKAHSDYPFVSDGAFKNRALLQEVMRKHHFESLPTEWWHFDFEGWQNDQKFPPLNFPQ